MGKRAGRPRKAGQRHPSGQLVQKSKVEKQIDDRVRTSRQPHRRMLRAEDRLDERAESPLGRLLIKGYLGSELVGKETRISEQAHLRNDAGTMYAQVVGAFRSTIEAPRSTSGSGRGSGCISERYGQGDACRWDPDSCACLKRRDRYMAAFEALAQAGRSVLMAVNRVAVAREAIAPEEMVNLVAGLDVLVRHFGLTPRRGGAHYQNAN